MITTEEISQKVYNLLKSSAVNSLISGVIDYERTDYTKEDVIIVPHTIDGEGTVRYGQININIHVPDLLLTSSNGTSVRTNTPRLNQIRTAVITVLKNHWEPQYGYNWIIGRLNPAIKEQNHEEHFYSIALSITVREKD